MCVEITTLAGRMPRRRHLHLLGRKPIRCGRVDRGAATRFGQGVQGPQECMLCVVHRRAALGPIARECRGHRLDAAECSFG